MVSQSPKQASGGGARHKAKTANEKKEEKMNEEVEQLRNVFNYFDTDRDDIIDAQTTKRILDILGFHNPPMPSREPAWTNPLQRV